MNNHKTIEEVLEYRKEIEAELVELLVDTGSDSTLDDIKKVIYDEKDHSEMQDIIMMLDDGDQLKLSNVLEIVTDAWNYFPHKVLGGISPMEKNIKYIQNEKSLQKNKPLGISTKNKKNSEKMEMPRVQVGDSEMSWEDYQKMLEEMEKQQVPFKAWIDGVMNDYKKHLSKIEKLPEKMINHHCFIAEVFFDRALCVGFLNMQSIRPEFIDKEFPRWWPSHVMSRISSKEVSGSIKSLVNFIDNRYRAIF